MKIRKVHEINKSIVLVIILISISVFADAQKTSNLIIFSKNEDLFKVTLNGIEQNIIPLSIVKMNDLQSVSYEMKIIFENTTYNSIENNIFTKTGYETTYIIKNQRNGQKELRWYNDTILPQKEIVKIEKEKENKDTEKNKKVYKMPGYSGPIGCSHPMSDANFRVAKNTVLKTDFESKKLIIAKQIVTSNCLTANQVKHLAGSFDFEDTKIRLAKFAYKKTYDVGNYFIVFDVFEFYDSILELNNYIEELNK